MAKILFVQDIAYEYFGVMYISAYLKAHGHQCDVIIENLDKNLMQRIKDENPDLVGFSVLTGSFKWAVEKAEIIKRKFGKKIIFGGVHVFTNPASTMEHEVIDIVCTGEGEEPVKELCDSIDTGKMDTSIKGLWFRTPEGVLKNPPSKLVDDLDALPFADRSIYWKYPIIKNRTTFPIMGSRGCPYTCTYCFIPTAKKIFEGQGKFIRERTADNILREVKECLEESPEKKQVHFVEDHFGNNRQRTLKILYGLSELKKGTMRWAGAIRIERFNKEEYVQELAKTNHGLLGMAVECGNEKYRNTMLKRPVTNQELLDAAHLANKYGIRFTTLNMVGLPGETFEMALQTLELNIKLKPVYANCYIYQPYPNTELQQYSVEHKLIEENVVNKLGFSWYDRYLDKDPRINKLINLQRIFGLTVAFPILKRPLLKLVELNAKRTLDVIFGTYYLVWLFKFYKLTFMQVFESLILWLKYNLSWRKNPATISVNSGDAQLYAEME